MRKIKYIVVALLVLVLIAGGAVLPWGVSVWQDGRVHGRIQYSDTGDAALDAGRLTDFEKLQLLAVGSYVDADSAQVEMTQNGVRSAAVSGLLGYVENGLTQPLGKFDEFSCSPRLYLPVTTGGKGNIFWSVEFHDPAESASIHLLLDDNTGKIFSFEYWSAEGLPGEDHTLNLLNLQQVFFKEMDVVRRVYDYKELTESPVIKESENELVVSCMSEDYSMGSVDVRLISNDNELMTAYTIY